MLRGFRNLPTVGIALAVVGIALLAVEVTRTLGGTPLGTLGTILLWAGVALLVIAVVALATSLFGVAETAAAGVAGAATADDVEPTSAEPTV